MSCDSIGIARNCGALESKKTPYWLQLLLASCELNLSRIQSDGWAVGLDKVQYFTQLLLLVNKRRFAKIRSSQGGIKGVCIR